MTDNLDLQNITQKIVKQFQPNKIILFGSQVWGEPNRDSDFDLMILKDTDNTRQLAQAIDGSIFPRPFPIDIIVYTPWQMERRCQSGDQFMNKIMTEGTTLYAE